MARNAPPDAPSPPTLRSGPPGPCRVVWLRADVPPDLVATVLDGLLRLLPGAQVGVGEGLAAALGVVQRPAAPAKAAIPASPRPASAPGAARRGGEDGGEEANGEYERAIRAGIAPRAGG